MELNITNFFEDENPAHYSASIAELGDDAGRTTWNASLEYAGRSPLLTTPEQLDAAREFFAEFGAWDDEEINAWTPQEINALMTQYIAGTIREDIRERGPGWPGEELDRIYSGDDGQKYIYIGP